MNNEVSQRGEQYGDDHARRYYTPETEPNFRCLQICDYIRFHGDRFDGIGRRELDPDDVEVISEDSLCDVARGILDGGMIGSDGGSDESVVLLGLPGRYDWLQFDRMEVLPAEQLINPAIAMSKSSQFAWIFSVRVRAFDR